jgi:PAS domain-containing protein
MTESYTNPTPEDRLFFDLMADSFARLVGRPLGDTRFGARSASWLYRAAPFVVLAHNTDADPRFIYANRAAQACFGYDWDEFVTLPSRLSAEPDLREERQAALDSVARNGFVADYSGIRIAKSGRRFRISDAVVWQLIDAAGTLHGQAATFASWEDV